MPIKHLRLDHYRNYDRFFADFDSNLNVIIGPNGIGKTNILESLIVLSNTKSFRCSDDSMLIRKGDDFARIMAEGDEGRFKVVIAKNSKSLYLNDVSIKKTSQFIGRLNCILFKPGDLELFHASPKERRKLIDVEIGKISSEYLKSLSVYNSLLKEKNGILKEEKVNETLLELTENMMIPEIEKIITIREEFFETINGSLTKIYQDISSTEVSLEVRYKKCAEKENISEQLLKNRDKDRYYRYTTFGPHLEDYTFYIDQNEVTSVASQGQKRMIMISFKIALASYILQKTGKRPIILLDDVLSELDEDNQNRLLNLLPDNTQIIITNTDLNKVKIRRKYKVIDLKEA